MILEDLHKIRESNFNSKLKSGKKIYKSVRKYKCPFCEERHQRQDLVNHVYKSHKDMIPENYTADRVVFESINGKNYGTCMICKSKVYTWDEKHCRYKNLCDSKSCRDEVRRIALERHVKVYNKPTLLDDPEWQANKMLANRKISGTYTFSDGGKKTYTGSYEKKCLEFLDKVLHYSSDEIECPGPTFYYEYDGKKHFYISDIYIIPINLVIEVKDGGSNPNTRTMTSYREKQLEKEKMITKEGKFNYLRLTDNQFDQLLYIIADIKYDIVEERPVKIHINEAGLAASPAASAFPRSSDSNVYIVPKMMHSVFDDCSEMNFYIQTDLLSESFIGQGNDGKLHIYNKKELMNIPYAFKYVGENANDKINLVRRLYNSNRKLRKGVILEIFLGHKPMVQDEILCSNNFIMESNPWINKYDEYMSIIDNVYNEAMSSIKHNVLDSIKENMNILESTFERSND